MFKNSIIKLNVLFIARRNFAVSNCLLARRPPKEEYENNQFHTRKRTADPFDRRWRWTAKSAEPYNVNGGHVDWTKMTITHRGVQAPGYYDQDRKQFFHVEDMVPEIIVPDLKDCKLKPYVSYNVKEIENEIFDAKTLYKKTIQTEIVKNYKKKEQIKQENN